MNSAMPCADANHQQQSSRNITLPSSGFAVPLSMAKVGETGTIVSVSGREEVRKFLGELGFTVGSTVKAVSLANGNVIVDVKGSKIAINRDTASKIRFSPES